MIAGLFSVSVVYPTIVFGLLFKERINCKTCFGMSVILSGVVCVGFK